ncbi:uncharacterized protein PFL1_01500 [Pseudozyma flocculosa PF-1]|uniref:uncharacterized protein n=1 Tax=Pseudozyma flocculosa PF-1 TaxID=1277687 RepID=UPI0004561B65|nr:uncharacterized protein PFL1_01500 [Pseudozyma flocculosa PF-1]EPQ31315.1 hypothetical protein PFL1_01500 [Pseudozyma flocculosa PF-1]
MTVIDTTRDLDALFRRQVSATPDALALEDKASRYTYSQLDAAVEALSDRFRRQYRVARDTLVGILMGRGADYVIACLAALRAGGAFLVLELAYPPGLLADVIADANPAVIVTQEAHAKLIKADVPTILLDQQHPPTATANGAHDDAQPLPPLPKDTDLDRLAFVSYSSGTTGKPKGIANPHRAPVGSYALRFAVNDLHPGDRVACNVYFVWEMLRPLLRGATTYAVPDEASYDPVALVELLASKNITETLMTPTLLAAVLSRHSKLGEKLPALRSLWLNGEVVTTDLARRAVRALPNARLLNCYSASETHEVACGDIGEMLKTLDADAAYCPVGPPMDLPHTYILDEAGNPVAPGTPGELVVGGPNLARGYLNLPDTTAAAFTRDTFAASEPGARKYRTGDLARILPGSGLLEITGRVGGMIKIRGYSIVPGTVEKAIIDKFAVSSCAVVAHGDGLERQLLAYLVLEDDAAERGERSSLPIDENGYSPVARQTLVQVLAHYMIPTLWVVLDSLPTHEVSGKVDLKNLPSPSAAIAAANATGSRTRSPGPDEMINIKSIAKLWALSLNMSPESILEAGKTVSFFDLGGHSLSLADLATRISKTLGGFTVPVGELAGSPSLEGHVQVLINARDGHNAAVQADLPAILRADSVLSDEFRPKAGSPKHLLRDADTVLLTGTTGFLGGFLLHDILASTSARVICLIRFDAPYRTDRSAAMARLRRNMLDLGLWDNSMLDRIDVLPANLSRNRLGLVPDVYEELVAKVQVIVHCAAQVNLVYPYAALRDANVEGTREILRLACLCNATVQYVSTNGVLPPSQSGWPESASMPIDDVPDKLLDGYCQTKWVAERLVLEAARRGLNATAVRIGTLSGHSKTGSTNTYDLITALIVESLHLGVAPHIDGWHVEMTAVDYVSKGIVALANHADGEQLVYHLGDPEPIDCQLLFHHLEALGYPTRRTDWESWVALWQEKRGSAKGGDHGVTVDILRSGMPPKEFLTGIIALRDDATRKAIGAELERPKIDARLLQTYARHWYSRGWLHRQPSSVPATPSVGSATNGVVNGLAAAGAAVVHLHKTDVTDRDQVESLMRTTAAALGPVDVIVSCAGVMYYTLMKNVKTVEWDQTVDVNCKGLLNVLSSSVPAMLARGSGHVVAISSDAGRKVFPGLGVYSASKFFVEATLQSLRLETAGTGLKVTSVQPGNTATDLLNMSSDAEAVEKYGGASGAQILAPEDVADSIVYALRLPPHVSMNEILIEPRDEPI